MNNIEIRINKKTKMVDLSKTFLGNEGESLQGKLIFSFDEFVEGQARLEFEIDGETDMIFLERVGETYEAPILSKLTKKGQIDMQLVITEGTKENEIAIFKSNVFYIFCNYSINAETEQPEEYPSWLEIANSKLNEIDNINLEVSKEEDKTIITLTKKDGSVQVVEVYDGTLNYELLNNIPKINDVSLIGNKTLDELGIQPKGDYVTQEQIPILNEVDPTVPTHVKAITKVDIENWNNKSGGGTTNYESLYNLPMVEGITLKGNLSLEQLHIQRLGNYANKNELPTQTSQLENNSGFVVGSNIKNIVAITQADFDALSVKEATTIYVIVG